ncbi:hypothetical protein [Planococcus halotolerans]|nr:hypothetical protein [Planococcus halotolerans]
MKQPAMKIPKWPNDDECAEYAEKRVGSFNQISALPGLPNGK